MIAKRSPRRANGQSSFRTLATYMMDAKGQGEKVAQVRWTNSPTDDPELALKAIEATQALNTRSRRDKTYHLIVSFPEGEHPLAEHLNAIEDRLCEAIGLGAHQRLSVVHTDTAHLHLHVAINKIHPTTHHATQPFQDKRRLYETCRQLERQYGLTPLHGPDRDEAIADRAASMEAHSGVQAFQTWVRGDPAHALHATWSQPGVTWQDLHGTLATFNLELRARGAGLVIAERDRQLFVKASGVSRELSKTKLEARLGPFARPGAEVQAMQAQQPYRRQPVHRHPEREALFQQYQQAKQRTQATKGQLLAALKQERQERFEAIQDDFAQRRQTLRHHPHLPSKAKRPLDAILKVERLAAQEALQDELRQRRQAILAQHRLRSWPDFLVQHATQGNESALAILRSRPRRPEREREAKTLASPDGTASHALFQNMRYQIDRWGQVTYTLSNGNTIRDEGRQLRLGPVSDASVEAALRMAQLKFGNTLRIEGSEEFKRQVVQVAAARHLRVIFSDAALEGQRLAQMAPGSQLAPRKEPERRRPGVER